MAAILPIGCAGRLGLARSTGAGRSTSFGAIDSVEERVQRLKAIAAMLLVLTLVASACGGDDVSAAGSDQAVNDESGSGGDGDPDGGGNDSGTENALCPLDDIASPPPDFPFVKPPSLIALAYDGPDQLGPGVYELRGVTFEPEEVISELMTVVFPDADFTQISDVFGQEAFDFIDPAGFGDYVSVTVICTNIGITLRVDGGAVGGDAAVATP